MENLTLYINLTIFPFLCSAQNQGKGEDLICWQENVKLKIGDFQAETNPLSKTNSFYNFNAANAASEITVNPVVDSKGNKDFIVKVRFIKSKSWIRDSLLLTPEVLAHEQIHFDIAELTGSMIRKEINNAKGKNIDVYGPIFTVIINDLPSKRNSIDSLYDKETDNGTKEIQQKNWQAFVQKELNKFSNYKSTATICQ